MDCLYCGTKLSALSSKDRQFCNKKHQELWREQEAQLSIQRLKEAFGFAASPSSKSRNTTTSVLDSPSREIPPDPEFTSQDPREMLVAPPVSGAAPEEPPANPDVIYCGPASNSDAPPNAGFVSVNESKGAFRLPFFVRRPEPVEKGGGEAVAGLVVPAVVDGRIGFIPAASVTAVDVCTIGQPGHSAPKPSLELSASELLQRPVEDQIRKLAFEAFAISSGALAAQAVGPGQEIPVQRNWESSEIPVSGAVARVYEVRPMDLRPHTPELRLAYAPCQEAILASLPGSIEPRSQASLSALAMQARAAEPVYETQPMVLGRRAPELRRAFTLSQETMLAGLPRSIAIPEAAFSAPALEALPVACELTPVPRNRAFEALTAARSERAGRAKPTTSADAGIQTYSSAPQVQVALRELAVQGRTASLASIQAYAAAPRAEKLEAGACRTAERVYEARPVALHMRPAGRPRSVSRPGKFILASLPSLAAGQPQAAGAAKMQPALAIPMTRVGAAPLPGAFRHLAPGHLAPAPRTTLATTPSTDLSHQKLRAKLRIPSREPAVQSYKVPSILVAPHALAPKFEEPETAGSGASWPVHEMRPPTGQVRPKIRPRNVAKRPPMAARYPKVVPASLPGWGASRPPSTLIAARPFRPSSDLPHRELHANLVEVSSRGLELHSCKVPSALSNTQGVVKSRQESGVKMRGAGQPVQEMRPPIWEVRPTVHLRPEGKCVSVVAPHAETTPAVLPRLTALAPEVALPRASRALLVAIGRLNAALPNSGFESLATGQRVMARRANRGITPTVDSPARELQGKPVQIELRKLAIPEGQPSLGTIEAELAAPFLETLEAKMCRASEQGYEVRPIALFRRMVERQPVSALYRQPALASFERPTIPQPFVADVPPMNAHALPVAMRTALTPSISPFLELPAGAPAPHIWAAATQLGPTSGISFAIDDRRSSFIAQASVARHPAAGLGAQRRSHDPEFLVSRSDCRVACPSRPLPSWDPEWLGPQQFVRWSPWIGPAVRPPQGAIFTNHPGGGRLALAAANSNTGLIRIAAWTEASESLNQSALILQLPRREGDSVLVQIRPAPAPPAEVNRTPRTATRTLAASGAPAAANREMRWVAYKVPWVPMP